MAVRSMVAEPNPHFAAKTLRATPTLPQPVVWLAALITAAHLVTAGRHGIFRDELYYLACARHLAWGYVDQPPLIAGIAWLVTHTLGTSLVALRLLPALASGALVWLTAWLARELGGGRTAQAFAGMSVVAVPVYLILNHWLTMNAFEPLLWTAVAACAARMIRTHDPRWWSALGTLAGLGFENKYSMLLPIAALVVGLLVTPERRLLRSRWFLTGTALAVALALPNLIWLVQHHFPFLEFERHSRASGSRIVRGPMAFLLDQALIINPVLAPLAVAGAAWLLISARGRRFRGLGVAAVAVVAGLMLVQAKNYYVAPIYPLLFAAGAVPLEKLWWGRPRLRFGYAVAVALSGLVLAPLVMPVLTPDGFVRYRQALGGLQPVTFERMPGDLLPQHFSDEFGWEPMVRATAQVYAALPSEERARTAIFANNYGEAAAIDFFGPRYGLPPAISKNETYWLWGPRGYTGSTVIVLGSDGTGDREHFRSVEPAGRVGGPYVRGEERFTIWLCRGMTLPLSKLWPKIKAW